MPGIEHFLDAGRMDLLSELHARALIQGKPARTLFGDGSGCKVQASGTRARLLVWTGTARTPQPRMLEDIGEDMGFFEPTSRPHACAESPNAVLIFGGFGGQPCTHDWGMWMHDDAKKTSSNMGQCAKCSVRASRETARQGSCQEWSYDVWGLRPHIWQRWMTCGPPPGSLSAQAWHQQKGKS